MGFFRDLFGPRQPCDLCQLGQASWPADRSASAGWKLRGHGLRADLFICVQCRRILFDTGLIQRTPMVAMARMVAVGWAPRPALHTYLQHPEWRKIWIHLLEQAGHQFSDEFAALQAMQPIEQEVMTLFSEDQDAGHAPRERAFQATDLEQALSTLAAQYGLSADFVRRKYLSYVLALRMSGQTSNWNDEVDGAMRASGKISDADIAAARTDFDLAVLNRVRLALSVEMLDQ